MPNVKNVNRFLFIKHNKQETVSAAVARSRSSFECGQRMNVLGDIENSISSISMGTRFADYGNKSVNDLTSYSTGGIATISS